jgi:hypothetical protein
MALNRLKIIAQDVKNVSLFPFAHAMKFSPDFSLLGFVNNLRRS